MDETKLISPLCEILEKDFSLVKNELPVVSSYNEDLEKIREHLRERVAELMENDFDLFVNTLYRIDVPEPKIRAAFNDKDKSTLNQKIADLILERELQRVRTRIMYKEGKL